LPFCNLQRLAKGCLNEVYHIFNVSSLTQFAPYVMTKNCGLQKERQQE